MMHDQCPECYGYDVATLKFGNLFLWIGLSLAVNAALIFVVFSGVVENVIPWIIGFVLLDTLIMLPLLATVRNRSQHRGATYRCRACGHTWSEATMAQKGEIPMASSDDASLSPFADSAAGFRLTVQDVFSIKGRGTVVTGLVETGTITAGAAIEIHGPSGVTQTAVQGIEMFRRTTSQANVGDNVGILLRGVQRDQVKRGDVLRG